ncbi:MAG: AlpA family phage regulatory protein [Hyphomicrobium sp.]
MKEAQRFLRRDQVLALLGCKNTKLYAMIAAGEFPRAIKLSPRIAVWPERDVIAFQNKHIAAQRPTPKQ